MLKFLHLLVQDFAHRRTQRRTPSPALRLRQILLATWDAFRLVILADGRTPQPKTNLKTMYINMI